MPRSTRQKSIPRSIPKSIPTPRSIPKSIPKSIPAPAPAPVQSHSMFDTIKQGFSFGIGSSIAHRVFDSSPHKNENIPKNEVNTETKLTTEKMYELYNKCLEKNDNNIDCNIILQQKTC